MLLPTYFSLLLEGYAGYYGLSLIVGSYSVLFVSLAAHAAQFAFLVFFENPRMCPSPYPALSDLTSFYRY